MVLYIYVCIIFHTAVRARHALMDKNVHGHDPHRSCCLPNETDSEQVKRQHKILMGGLYDL